MVFKWLLEGFLLSVERGAQLEVLWRVDYIAAGVEGAIGGVWLPQETSIRLCGEVPRVANVRHAVSSSGFRLSAAMNLRL